MGNLSNLANEEDLLNIFNKYGQVNSINLFSSKGYAYVLMDRRESADKAQKSANGNIVYEKPIRVSFVGIV